jgi:hypothetical protein
VFRLIKKMYVCIFYKKWRKIFFNTDCFIFLSKCVLMIEWMKSGKSILKQWEVTTTHVGLKSSHGLGRTRLGVWGWRTRTTNVAHILLDMDFNNECWNDNSAWFTVAQRVRRVSIWSNNKCYFMELVVLAKIWSTRVGWNYHIFVNKFRANFFSRHLDGNLPHMFKRHAIRGGVHYGPWSRPMAV